MVAMLGGVLLAGAASAAPFQNGSFELGNPPASARSLDLGNTDLTGWAVIDDGDPANTNYTAAGGASVSALVDGVVIGTLANLDTSQVRTWTTDTCDFLASGGSTTLDLVKVTGGNYTGRDNVRVVDLTPDAPVLSPAPEPASWAMMLAGFGLVGGAPRAAAA